MSTLIALAVIVLCTVLPTVGAGLYVYESWHKRKAADQTAALASLKKLYEANSKDYAEAVEKLSGATSTIKDLSEKVAHITTRLDSVETNRNIVSLTARR